MDFSLRFKLKKTMPLLYKILAKHSNLAININDMDRKLTVSILRGKSRKTFTSFDDLVKHYF